MAAATLIGVAAPATALTPGVAFSAVALPTWQTNGIAWAMAEANGVMYVGGTFTAIRPPKVPAGGAGSVSAVNFAAFDAYTGTPTSCTLSFTGGTGATVRAMDVSPDGRKLYVGGNFTTVNGVTANRLAAINLPNCTVDTTFRPGTVNNTVRTIAATADAVSATATAAAGTRDLCGRVTQRRADLIDLELDGDAVLPLAVLVGPLLQATAGDDPHALGERTGHVLGEVAPHARAEEQRFAVLPLVRLTVETARRRRDREVRDGQSALRVPQLGVCREVSHNGDDGLASHRRYAFAAFAGAAALRAAFASERSFSAATMAIASSARWTLVRMICSLSFS